MHRVRSPFFRACLILAALSAGIYFLFSSSSPTYVQSSSISRIEHVADEKIVYVDFVLQNDSNVRMKVQIQADVGVNAPVGFDTSGERISSFRTVGNQTEDVWVAAKKSQAFTTKIKIPVSDAYLIGTTGVISSVTIKSAQKDEP